MKLPAGPAAARRGRAARRRARRRAAARPAGRAGVRAPAAGRSGPRWPGSPCCGPAAPTGRATAADARAAAVTADALPPRTGPPRRSTPGSSPRPCCARRGAHDGGRRRTCARPPGPGGAGPAMLRARGWYAEALARDDAGNPRGARTAIRAGLRLLDEHRAVLGATDVRAHAAGHRTALAELGLRIALRSGAPREVLEWAERGRATGLLMQRSGRPPDDPETADVVAALRGTVARSPSCAAPAAAATSGPCWPARPRWNGASGRGRCGRGGGRTTRSAPPAGVDALDRGAGRRRRCWSWWTPTARSSRSPWPAAGSGCTGSGRCARRTTCSTGSPSPSPGCCDPTCPARCARRRAPCCGTASPAPTPPCCSALPELADRPLVVVPTGSLQNVPWALLPSCAGRPVTVSPSATLWLARPVAAPTTRGTPSSPRARRCPAPTPRRGRSPPCTASRPCSRPTRPPSGCCDRSTERPWCTSPTHGRLAPHNPLFSQLHARRRAAVRLRHRAAGAGPAHGGARGVRERAVGGVRGRRAARARRDVPRPRVEPARGVPAAGPGRRDRAADDGLPPAARGRPAGRRGAGAGAAELRGGGTPDVAAGGFVCVGSGFGRASRCVPAPRGRRRAVPTPVRRPSALVAADAGVTLDRRRCRHRAHRRQRTHAAAPAAAAADQQPAGRRQAAATSRSSSRRPRRRRTPRARATCARPARPCRAAEQRAGPERDVAGARRPAEHLAGRLRRRPPHPRRAASRGLTSAATPSATRDAASRPPAVPHQPAQLHPVRSSRSAAQNYPRGAAMRHTAVAHAA